MEIDELFIAKVDCLISNKNTTDEVKEIVSTLLQAYTDKTIELTKTNQLVQNFAVEYSTIIKTIEHITNAEQLDIAHVRVSYRLANLLENLRIL